MAETTYIIHTSDGEKTFSIPESSIDTSNTSINLIGHNQADYGEAQNENFLHMLENFASDGSSIETTPNKPIRGQIWYKKINESDFKLMVYNGTEWVEMLKLLTSEGQGKTQGDLYFDGEVLKAYNPELGWVKIGPVDTEHVERLSYVKTLVGSTSTSYDGICYDESSTSGLAADIQAVGDTTVLDLKGKGALNLVKMNILAKGFNSQTYTETARCCCWCYKVLIQSIKIDENTYDMSIVGKPSYELIAKSSDDLNWTISMDFDTSNDALEVTFNCNSLQPNECITLGFDTEIIKV